MRQSGHLNPSEETGTGCPVTSKYGRAPPNKHGSVGRQQHERKYISHSNRKCNFFIGSTNVKTSNACTFLQARVFMGACKKPIGILPGLTAG